MPNIADFYSFFLFISCIPGLLLRYFLDHFEIFPVSPITGIIIIIITNFTNTDLRFSNTDFSVLPEATDGISLYALDCTCNTNLFTLNAEVSDSKAL